jgi:hypothetical protein
VGIALLALTAPTRLAGTVIAVLFVCFALVSARLGGETGDAGCGCFGGEHDAAPGRVHAAVNLVAALAAAAAAVQSPPSLAQVANSDPARALAIFAVACIAAVLWREAATRLPAAARETPDAPLSERLVNASAVLLEQRFSRRSALIRIAVAGSALCVAPLRYLLYPTPALALLVPEDCGQGDCTDGYTAFCCEINEGRNSCPEGTFPGGWWMCTDYRGRQLCSGVGVRYYVDCNALPGHPYPGGCRCANGTCDERRVNCNIFRYGQCNTQVEGVTAVVCRMVTCRNPGLIPALNCSTSVSVDDAVCGHEVPCLEPSAVQLAGAGGV